MNKLGVVFSIIVITIVFIYTLILVSEENTCTGVRIFDCQKSLVSDIKHQELKVTGDIFLKNCNPKITEQENVYLLDYSDCNLKVSILKEKPWVDNVEVNGDSFTREQIDNNF